MRRSLARAGGSKVSGRGSHTRSLVTALCALCLVACQVEKREIGPSPPASPPSGVADLRVGRYETNRYEISEGGRMFRWLGCDGCHTELAEGFLDLSDGVWRKGGSTTEIYRSIAQGAPGMPTYGGRITPQQTWQLAGYVQGLKALTPSQRRRNANAQQGEPSGSTWRGPL